MNRNGAKSRSRGEKLTNPTTTIIKATQDKTDEQSRSPLRNESSRWKAHTVNKTRSPSTSPAGPDKSHKKANLKTKYPDVTKNVAVPKTKEKASTPKSSTSSPNPLGLIRSDSASSATKQHNNKEKPSTPKSSSSSPNPLGLIRSASAGSAQKQNKNTLPSGDLRRSMSDNSPLAKNRTPIPTTNLEHEHSTTTRSKEQHTNPPSSPANSEVDSADERNDVSNKRARSGGTSSHKTPQDKDSPVSSPDRRSSHIKRKSQQLDSESNSDNDFEMSPVPSTKSKKGSARKVQKQKQLDLSSSDASIGNSNLLSCSQPLSICITFFIHTSSYNLYNRVDA